jgi:protein-S-isoprenylcysteine O-methyltransferase Ste14
MDPLTVDIKSLKKKIVLRFILLPFFFCFVLLLPAGTLYFWHVYVYFAVLVVPMIFVIRYFLKNDPEFLERRMKMKEKEKEQKRIVLFADIVYLIGFLLPGFDRRFGWSNIPIVIVIAADIFVMASYIFIIYVFKENRYASRVIEVEQNQTVISTGPYSIIRHPMYLGALVMILSTPIALGSYFALIPFATLPVSFAFRILNEEKILNKELPGYNEYCSKVRYRLIPYIW